MLRHRLNRVMSDFPVHDSGELEPEGCNHLDDLCHLIIPRCLEKKVLYRLICVSRKVGAYFFLVDRYFRKHLSISEREGHLEASHHHNLAITLTAIIRMICLVSMFARNLRKSDSKMCGDGLSVFEDPGSHSGIDEE